MAIPGLFSLAYADAEAVHHRERIAAGVQAARTPRREQAARGPWRPRSRRIRREAAVC